ncbi:MAG TPA: hypothetical protein VKU19_41030 [Bryobacteraceae bacterium]|nr:hypothetical protein [Bryobacteraceae bacterium]
MARRNMGTGVNAGFCGMEHFEHERFAKVSSGEMRALVALHENSRLPNGGI